MTESKSHSNDDQDFVNDHDEELMAISEKAISNSINMAFGIPNH